jgi:hypothetical protein
MVGRGIIDGAICGCGYVDLAVENSSGRNSTCTACGVATSLPAKVHVVCYIRCCHQNKLLGFRFA